MASQQIETSDDTYEKIGRAAFALLQDQQEERPAPGIVRYLNEISEEDQNVARECLEVAELLSQITKDE